MPPVTQALLITNVIIFLLQGAGGPGLIAWFALWPVAPSGPVDVPSFQVWQLVSYSFLHGGLAHLFFNMLALYMFGADIERLFGARFYLQYYFASVVAAGLCHLVFVAWAGGPPVPTVGASGGVYGVLLAYGLFFPRRTVVLLIPPIPMPARVFVVLFAILELWFGVTGTASGIAHFAHLGGMLGGFLMIQYRRGRFPFTRR
ncbi:MAG TPA: rhomboid family intramembrane serine protease [Burkholderiales bacterium]|nr:rhomboid family intramembrane serine protease [Burkholderiales bacterium]